ncbi:acyl-CoA dehydrogenase [uncultured Nocardioides sp.]|uniref:acyl-CoA dehydrogenase family protein n=1 Tax=uncultured Nocardioides sp. TaxID=198441 RepID=UPI00260A1EAF|nr:acyl-CoA dehydrogenase [uncultured Nocardioides sp.]
MDFTHDDEQKALAEAVRGLLARTYGSYEDRRRTVKDEPGYDEKLWTGLAEMGVLGLPFSEADGGMGAGPIESALVAEELGRVIAPEPFLTSVVLAGGLVAALGTDAQRAETLGALSEGELLLAPALAEPGRGWTAEARDVVATGSGDAWTLEGVKEPVPHGATAGRLVVTAALPDGGTGVFLVEGDADGVTRTGYATHDGGRAAQVRLSGASATLLGDGTTDAAAAVARVVDETRVVACHQALGAMTVALESTTEYLRSRKQFGVPLATFQALTFRAADMYVSLELARSLAQWAAMVLGAASTGSADADPADAARRAALGTSRAARHVGQEAIQLHGGIAMTAEYHVGNYVSHLTALDHLLGDGHHHLRALAADVGGHAEVDPLP